MAVLFTILLARPAIKSISFFVTKELNNRHGFHYQSYEDGMVLHSNPVGNEVTVSFFNYNGH